MSALGKQLRDNQLNLFESQNSDFIEQCRAVARQLAAQNGEVTVDEVRDLVPLPENRSAKAYGAVFKKGFKKIGYVTTKRASSHGRPIAQWILKESADG
jgi:hypothetical protein